MNNILEIHFPKLNHFWLDSGLVGLEILLRDSKEKAECLADETGLTLKGSEDEIQLWLEKAYDRLVKDYYNLSTKKQKEETTAFNFYFDSKTDQFIAFPKKKAVGIAEIIYDKAPRPSGTSIKWAREEKCEISVNGKPKKLNRGVLPLSHSHLQIRMSEFLDSRGLDVTTAGLLMDGPNQVRPNVEIVVKPGKIKGPCYFCGESSHALEEASQTTFPFITGSSGVLSFNSTGGKPEKACWKCAFVSKFVPVNGFYISQGEEFIAFLPYSTSFEKMLEVYLPLQEAKFDDPSLFKNFRHSFVTEKSEGFFQKPFEMTFAFLFTLYKKVLLHQKTETDEGNFNWENICSFTLSKAPLDFFVIHTQTKGQTSMGKTVWPFKDSIYFFRLMKSLEENGVNIKDVMRNLIDFSQKNETKTLVRNRVCERILKKQTILNLIESHVFSSDINFIKNLLDLVIVYEPIVRKENANMTKEEQEASVTLGKRIGMVVAHDGKKGDLFALRKARRKTDFLNELNRLQFKCNLTVPPDVYEGKFTDGNFLEFKQFCMIAAMNSYQAGISHKGGNQQP